MKLELDHTEGDLVRSLLAAELEHKRVEVRRARNLDYKEELRAQERVLKRLVGRLQRAGMEEQTPDVSGDLFAVDGPDQTTWVGFESSPGDSLQ